MRGEWYYDVGLLVLVHIFVGIMRVLIPRLWLTLSMTWTTAAARHVSAVNDNGTSPSSSTVAELLLRSEAGKWKQSGEPKVTCGPRDVVVKRSAACGEFKMEIFFKIECEGDKSKTRVSIELEQANIVLKSNCSVDQFFVLKMTIELCPKNWAQNHRRLVLEPHITAKEFQVQDHSSVNFRIITPHQATLTCQASNRVSHAALSFEWSPAVYDASDNSVTWPFEFLRLADGSKIFFRKRWTRPQLGIDPAYVELHPEVKSTWEIPRQTEQHELELAWDVKVTVHPALLKKDLIGWSITRGEPFTFDDKLTFAMSG